jgi:hypothetical protein
VVAITLTHFSSESTTTTPFLTYTNPHHGVSIQYHSDWTKNETVVGNQFVEFNSSQINNIGGNPVATVRIGTYPSSSSLSDDLRNDINGYQKNPNAWPNFQLLGGGNSTLAGQPAYSFTGTYKLPGTSEGYGVARQVTVIGTIMNSKVYYIQASIDADQYSNYLPIVQKMIKSFAISA